MAARIRTAPTNRTARRSSSWDSRIPARSCRKRRTRTADATPSITELRPKPTSAVEPEDVPTTREIPPTSTEYARDAADQRTAASVAARRLLDSKRLADEAVGDWQAAVAAEGAWRDLDAWRGLPPLVLRAVDHLHDAVDDLGVGALGDYLVAAAIVLDVGLEDRVEHVIGRQGILVELVGPQLRRGR